MLQPHIPLLDIEIENFLSYGNYTTRLKLADQQQCFITGEIAEFDAESGEGSKSSNGAGKSSLLQSILWCLTGRTMHRKNPGSKVINYFTDGDCRVQLRFKTGEVLSRVRRRNNETSLLFQRNGQDVLDCTLSTTPNMQKLLDKELRADWDVFCGSVFCSQYHKPWLEMSDAVRKAAFERITGIDRLTIYSNLAKGKKDKAVIKQDNINAQLQLLDASIKELEESIETTKNDSSSFIDKQRQKKEAKLKEAEREQEKADKFQLVDLDKLSSKWEIVEKIRTKVKELYATKDNISSQIEDLDNQKDNKADNLRNKLDDKVSKIEQVKSDLQNKASAALKTLERQRTELRDKLSEIRGELKPKKLQIDMWHEKEGTICIECEQQIDESHTTHKIHEIEEGIKTLESDAEVAQRSLSEKEQEITKHKDGSKSKLDKLNDAKIDTEATYAQKIAKSQDEFLELRADLVSKRSKIEETISSAESKVESNIPDITVKEAKAKNSQKDQLLALSERLRKEAEEISLESDPHVDIIDRLEKQLATKKVDRKTLKKRQDNFNVIFQHLHYIYRSYSDRRKIKSYLISKHIPYFNSRLAYYLDNFRVDVKIAITDSLGIQTDKWGYDFLSGGERRRVDVAFMFAVMDLHEAIHGKQCNILVLDEVDGRLDEAGVEDLIGVIKNDLASKFESIFIISHRKLMKDVFPNNIVIKRTDRFSQIWTLDD